MRTATKDPLAALLIDREEVFDGEVRALRKRIELALRVIEGMKDEALRPIAFDVALRHFLGNRVLGIERRW